MVELTINHFELSNDPMELLKECVNEHKLLMHRQEQLERELKETKVSLSNLEKDTLPAILSKMGGTSISLKDGTKLEAYQKVFTTFIASEKETALTWLEQHGYSGVIKTVTKRDVHPQTLHALGRELVEEKGVYLPDHMFNQYIVEGVKITHGKNKLC